MKHYRVPRYLGLQDIVQKKKKHFVCSFGFSKKTLIDVELDDESLKLLETCFKPRSFPEIRKMFPKKKVKELDIAVKTFVKLGLLEVTPLETPPEVLRYDRHMLFYSMQGIDSLEAQKKLRQKTVTLIGMGGIGNWVTLNLIGVGLKQLRLIDFDTVELSNLTRQVIFSEDSIGKHKTLEAKKFLKARNSDTEILSFEKKAKSTEQLKKYLKGSDFVVLSADRPAEIHDWVDAACVELRIPYINLGYRDGMGVVGPMTSPGITSCYQCFKPRPRPGAKKRSKRGIPDRLSQWDARYQAPSFGSLNALVSTVGSLEILKYFILPKELKTLDTELHLDPIELTTERKKYARDPKCWHCKSFFSEKVKQR